MVLNKGISPLVASIVLIAFVVAVAGIASTFFTDITEEWGGQVGEQRPIDCAVASIDTDERYWSFDEDTGQGSITVFIERSPLSHLGVTVRDVDQSTSFTDFNAAELDEEEYPVEDGMFQPGRSYNLEGINVTFSEEDDIQSLTVRTADCPVSKTVEF